MVLIISDTIGTVITVGLVTFHRHCGGIVFWVIKTFCLFSLYLLRYLLQYVNSFGGYLTRDCI